MKIGIVGLPNVGKSTLFNALTRTRKAEARNYPFCTIEPNVGIVQVPDERLEFLQRMTGTDTVIPAAVEFVDIAGLVAGASSGEGLGNRFLASIREMDAIIHVVRCFEDSNILHIAGDVDPLRDLQIIEMELLLADLESLQNQLGRQKKRAKSLDKDSLLSCVLAERLIVHLNGGQPAHTLSVADDEVFALKRFCLLTSKPVLYVCNVGVDELANVMNNKYVATVSEYAKKHKAAVVSTVSAQLEEELGELSVCDAKKFLHDLGVLDSGVSTLIRSTYKLLCLGSFFTAGVQEVRAWTFRFGMRAPECAGIIHGDFEKGFIKAEIVAFEDLQKYGSTVAAREAGRYRIEGKDYVFKDGDVAHFRFAAH